MDLLVQDVAFLWITNSSGKPYYVAMAGGTNTSLPDAPIGFQQSSGGGSYMPMCEFRDQPPAGYAPPPVSFGSLGLCVNVGPHSALRLRVPLPPEGQKRKVAVLCIKPPAGRGPFWTSSVGRTYSCAAAFRSQTSDGGTARSAKGLVRPRVDTWWRRGCKQMTRSAPPTPP